MRIIKAEMMPHIKKKYFGIIFFKKKFKKSENLENEVLHSNIMIMVLKWVYI